MRILVLSDIHKDWSGADKIIAKHNDINHVFFLGDGIDHVDTLSAIHPHITFHSVSGNCDPFSFAPSSALEELAGVRILFTHGNIFSVKSGLGRLKAEAKAKGVSLALFGHTHTPHSEYEDGVYYVNPGAAGTYPYSYAVVDLSPSGIMPSLLTL